MLDPKLLREKPNDIKTALKNRGEKPDIIDNLVKIDTNWRKLTQEVEKLKAQRNKLSDKVAGMKRKKEDTSEVIGQVKKIGGEIKVKEDNLNKLQDELRSISLSLPNIPHISVPVGKDETENKEIRKWGKIKDIKDPKAHYEIGESLSILDFQAGAKIAGSRFTVYKGAGAKLERALINFMLDVQTNEHNYTEVITPFMTNKDSMTGTGQLPKFEEDLYKAIEEGEFLDFAFCV